MIVLSRYICLGLLLALGLGVSSHTNYTSDPFQSFATLQVFGTPNYNSFPVMATLLDNKNGFHAGEQALHRLLNVPTSPARRNPTAPGMPHSYAYRVSVSPLLAVGTVDSQGRPWTSLWGGEAGFAQPVAENILGIQSLVDKVHDPVAQVLFGQGANGEVIQPGERAAMSALSIDLESRDRVKLAGKMVAGAVSGQSDDNTTIGEAQLAMHVQESLGNCPKYLNIKTIHAHMPSPQVVSSSLPLPPEAVALVEKADMFFVSSTNGQTMDTNHRGGPAGFLRVLSNSNPEIESSDGVVLVYPEYSGNRLYQTLGNLHIDSRIGIVIPDYETSDVLYLTGETQLLVGSTAEAIMPHTNLAVKITVHAARFVKDGLPFRGTPGEPSPYNPPVRRLASEQPSPLSQPLQAASSPLAIATLIRKEPLTPTIARFTFRLRAPDKNQNDKRSDALRLKPWLAGQHITLSFARHLARGYRHMNDADPQSLNDDFIRTFTISSPPPPSPPLDAPSSPGTPREDGEDKASHTQTQTQTHLDLELELTLRRHGPATSLLFAQQQPSSSSIPSSATALEIPVLGIAGGERGFRIGAGGGTTDEVVTAAKKKAVFVAGGIGITPLLAQAPAVLADRRRRLQVLWSLRAEDLLLAVDAFERIGGLAGVTRLFVTGMVGGISEDGAEEAVMKRARELGAEVVVRRMARKDVLGVRDAGRGTKYFACASPGLLGLVVDWLAGEEVAVESFEY